MDTIENDYRNFEKDVYELISKCLSEDETLNFDNHFDFFAPNGVKKLGWKKGTYIEVKYRLMPNSIVKLKRYFDELRPKTLIIIVLDKSELQFPLYFDESILPRRPILFEAYDELCEKAFPMIKDVEIAQEGIFEKYRIEKGDSNLVKAKNAIKNNRISLFLGAGVSKSAGSVGWDQLLKKLCDKRGLVIDNKGKMISDIQKGRYILDYYKGKNDDVPQVFYDDLRNILYEGIKKGRKDKKRLKLIKTIASLVTNSKVDLESVITFNYDDLIEQEITLYPNKYKKGCISIYQESVNVDRNSIYFYHVHGYLSEKKKRSEEIILGEKEYHQVYRDVFNWGNVEQLHALNRSTCFFIGLSMTDPNLRRLMDISYKESDKDCEHFVFLIKDEYNIEYMENSMRRFGVNCIWYDNHEDLPGLLDSLMDGI